MNVKFRNVLLGLIMLLVVGVSAPFTLTVYAEEEETLGEELQRDAKWLYDKGKESGKKFGSWIADKAPEVIDGVKEAAPEIAEDIKEATPGAIDKVKSGVSQASEAISDYREGQQEEFMDWFENQTGTGGSASESEQVSENTLATEDSTTGDEAIPSEEVEEVAIETPEYSDEAEPIAALVEEVSPVQADTDKSISALDETAWFAAGLLLAGAFVGIFFFVSLVFWLWPLLRSIYNRWFKKSK